LYAALNSVDIDEMSVTVVATKHPQKLLGFLRSRYKVKNDQQGIYLVEGDTSPTQIIVSRELPEDDNFWLTNLRNDLTEEQIRRVIVASEGRTGIDAYLYAIGEANVETLEELYMQRKEGIFLSEKLDAYFHERLTVPRTAKAILTVLRARFKRVPKEVEESILAMTDLIALDSWLVHAATCQSIDEFATALE
jgi:hypothetical protein